MLTGSGPQTELHFSKLKGMPINAILQIHNFIVRNYNKSIAHNLNISNISGNRKNLGSCQLLTSFYKVTRGWKECSQHDIFGLIRTSWRGHISWFAKWVSLPFWFFWKYCQYRTYRACGFNFEPAGMSSRSCNRKLGQMDSSRISSHIRSVFVTWTALSILFVTLRSICMMFSVWHIRTSCMHC